MIVKRAHHYSINVSDIERARAFYGGLLGLVEKQRPDFGFPGAWYQAGDVELHLIVPPAGVETGAPPPGLSPIAGHIAFEVEDYRSTKAHLEAAGVEVLGLGEKVGQMFVRDEDGNVVELIEPGGRLGRSAAPVSKPS